jgi:ABC-type antimicrobial peptide transport system permease subunit
VTVTLARASVAALLPQRFAALITSTLGLTGLLLAAIGLYGVLSFSTVQRTREMGVRMALGADRRDVVRLVVGEGMRVVAAGTAGGLVLALVATRALAPFLFGVNPLDVTTYVAMTLVLTFAAAVACFLPARRAAAADPMAALRAG